MKNFILMMVFLMALAVFVSGVWGEKIPPQAAFKGTVTNVDMTAKKFAVKNENGQEMTFQWNDETWVNGTPVKDEPLTSLNLEKGMRISVSYAKGENTRVARNMDLRRGNYQASRSTYGPFNCGMQIC